MPLEEPPDEPVAGTAGAFVQHRVHGAVDHLRTASLVAGGRVSHSMVCFKTAVSRRADGTLAGSSTGWPRSPTLAMGGQLVSGPCPAVP